MNSLPCLPHGIGLAKMGRQLEELLLISPQEARVLLLRAIGMTYRDIGWVLGVSGSRIQQISSGKKPSLPPPKPINGYSALLEKLGTLKGGKLNENLY